LTFIEPPGSSVVVDVCPPSWNTDCIGDGDTETVTFVADLSPLLVTDNGFVVVACVHCVGNPSERGVADMLTLA
jgi:hypothetical protein